jgi:hypothetical protein
MFTVPFSENVEAGGVVTDETGALGRSALPELPPPQAVITADADAAIIQEMRLFMRRSAKLFSAACILRPSCILDGPQAAKHYQSIFGDLLIDWRSRCVAQQPFCDEVDLLRVCAIHGRESAHGLPRIQFARAALNRRSRERSEILSCCSVEGALCETAREATLIVVQRQKIMVFMRSVGTANCIDKALRGTRFRGRRLGQYTLSLQVERVGYIGWSEPQWSRVCDAW